MAAEPKIFPLGDGAITIDLGNEISAALNDRAIALATYLDRHRFPGFIEAVPAYSSVAVFYDLAQVRRAFPEMRTAFEVVSGFASAAVRHQGDVEMLDPRVVEIPTDFGEDAAIDMDVLVAHSGLARTEVIELFTSKTYRVYMLGFLPGFSYMGEVDERIAAPRKDSPRKRVPKGSVGIAGNQTGIYPLESPGGWQIVGRTDAEMFTPNSESPCLLNPGDLVRFVPID
jgi:inhibitor of KinA